MSISHRRKAYLLALATRQRRLIYFCAAGFLAIVIANIVPVRHNAIPNILALVCFVCSIVYMFKLVRLRYGKLKAAIAAFLFCIPGVNLIVIGIVITLINSHTVSLGARPGIIGVDPNTIGEM